MISDRLAGNFVAELLAYSLANRSTFDVVHAYLKYSYLQREEEKKLVQWLFRNYDKTGRIATMGQLQQQFIKSDTVLELLADISDVEVDDTDNGHNAIISTFQEYLRQMMFLESNDRVTETWNRGDKEQAYKMFVEQAEKFSNFSILDAKFETVFEGFNLRMTRRRSEDYNFRFKIPTMIDEVDEALGGEGGRLGGPETGEYCLWLGASGAGKSQCLVHMGVTAARQGHRVAHFQLEGTKEQCLNRYDASWTGTLYRDMKIGDVSEKKLKALDKIISKLKKSDIYVYSCEEWGGMTLPDVRKHVIDLQKKVGKIDMIIIDYLELLEVGDGVHYSPKEERFRLQKLSRGMKTLAMEFNVVVHTATQSNDIDFAEVNDPEFVITRSNLSEDKGKLRPADIFITLNTTVEESRNQVMRLYIDKARDHQGKQVIRIANNFKCSRFYDRKRTADLIDEEEE